MNWIERYVNAVTHRLPKATRDDIGKEIESILRDKVEEQEESLGRPLEEAEVLAQLKEYGHPLQVAARYQDHRVLIGEAFFPMYTQVMKFMLLAALAAFFVSWTISASGMFEWWPDGAADRLSEFLPWYAILITAGFHVAERYNARNDFFANWNPRRLAPVHAGASHAPIGETAIYLAANGVAFAALSAIDGGFSFAALIGRAEGYWPLIMSLLKVLLVSTTALYLSLLVTPYWTRARLVCCAASALLLSYIGFLGWMGFDSVIERIRAEGAEGVEFLAQLWWFPVSFVIAGLFEAAWCLYRLARIRVV